MGLKAEDFLTVSQFARLCRVTRRTVYRWVEAGRAPRHEVMPDDRIYFYRAEAANYAEAWLKKQNSRREEAAIMK